MKYKLADTDKILVEVGDLRMLVDFWNLSDRKLEMQKAKYPAAFEEAKEEWGDVTEKVYMGDVHGFELIATHTGNYKIENNRIWRRK